MSAPIGVRVWQDPGDSGAFYLGSPMEDSEPYVAIPASPDALREMRERIAKVLIERYPETMLAHDLKAADAILALIVPEGGS